RLMSPRCWTMRCAPRRGCASSTNERRTPTGNANRQGRSGAGEQSPGRGGRDAWDPVPRKQRRDRLNHPTHILWQAAGAPAYPQNMAGLCRICGEPSAGVSFDGWVRDTFTNHDILLPGDIICHICQFAFDQAQPELTRRTGKDKPQRMQNYSHIVLRGEWHPLHKGQKAELLALLRDRTSVG